MLQKHRNLINFDCICLCLQSRVPKRSLEEINDLNGDNFDDDNNLLNIPIHALDRETLENSPWMKYLVIRKESV